MVSLRKAGAYSKRYARPYTRVSKKKSKSFIKTVPQKKIVKFNMGNQKASNEGKFDTEISLVSQEKVQMRDNAIEACRQAITRQLDKQIPGQFYFEVKVHPHHILRENKMLTGAGSDRMQTGMQKSFGKTIGRAAMVNPGQQVFRVETSGDKQIRLVKGILGSVKSKLPGKSKILEVKQ
ncbi:50S ribosomal protein L16 [Candidatus Pacearchaeota archaeon]|nr:50S ribosomal protein L16 [Candidatus Pacearchaeota archaeon]